jgi:wyosine [tRNA(Phe)-imidazoG37] synthetase (radical SAM superfamily)
MSDKLDRLEKLVESNAKAIEALANESTDFRHRITETIELLTQVVVRLDARQQDQENRINRLEQ